MAPRDMYCASLLINGIICRIIVASDMSAMTGNGLDSDVAAAALDDEEEEDEETNGGGKISSSSSMIIVKIILQKVF